MTVSSSATRPASGAPHASRLSIPIFILVALLAVFPQIVQRDLIAVYQDPVIRLMTLALMLLAAGLAALHQYRLVAQALLPLELALFGVAAAFVIALVETTVPLASATPGTGRLGGWAAHSGRRRAHGGPAAGDPRRRSHRGLDVAAGVRDQPVPARLFVTVMGAAHRLARPQLPAGAAGVPDRAPSAGCGRSRDDGARLGSYRLLSRIGEGGMGEVWKASHQMLARAAAIKLVRPVATAAPPGRQTWFIERFRREANVIAGLQSPHTVYLYDFGVSQDGQLLLRDGAARRHQPADAGRRRSVRSRPPASCQSCCRSARRSRRRTRRGLVHRDLKPSNVMVCKVALAHDFVKVLDFGLAKCAACEELNRITVEGTTAGHAGLHRARSRARRADGGRHVPTSTRSAASRYFLLTGTLVFPDTNPMSMALKHVQAQPDPPSPRTELPIPADLERIVMRCLEKKPADRPAGARDVAELLRACDVPGWTEAQAVEWWQRHLPQGSALRMGRDAIGEAPTITAAGA